MFILHTFEWIGTVNNALTINASYTSILLSIIK